MVEALAVIVIQVECTERLIFYPYPHIVFSWSVRQSHVLYNSWSFDARENLLKFCRLINYKSSHMYLQSFFLDTFIYWQLWWEFQHYCEGDSEIIDTPLAFWTLDQVENSAHNEVKRKTELVEKERK